MNQLTCSVIFFYPCTALLVLAKNLDVKILDSFFGHLTFRHFLSHVGQISEQNLDIAETLSKQIFGLQDTS